MFKILRIVAMLMLAAGTLSKSTVQAEDITDLESSLTSTDPETGAKTDLAMGEICDVGGNLLVVCNSPFGVARIITSSVDTRGAMNLTFVWVSFFKEDEYGQWRQRNVCLVGAVAGLSRGQKIIASAIPAVFANACAPSLSMGEAPDAVLEIVHT